MMMPNIYQNLRLTRIPVEPRFPSNANLFRVIYVNYVLKWLLDVVAATFDDYDDYDYVR